MLESSCRNDSYISNKLFNSGLCKVCQDLIYLLDFSGLTRDLESLQDDTGHPPAANRRHGTETPAGRNHMKGSHIGVGQGTVTLGEAGLEIGNLVAPQFVEERGLLVTLIVDELRGKK